jgi:hypothetical protein
MKTAPRFLFLFVFLFTALLAGAACGGRVALDPQGSSTTSAGSGGGSSSGTTGGGGGPGGVGGSGGEGQLPCASSQDCWGAATCQQGFCCSGVYTNGACTCGAEPECDLQHLCCKLEGTDLDAGLTCVPGSLAMGKCSGPF